MTQKSFPQKTLIQNSDQGIHIFDRALVKKHRDYAANNTEKHNFLTDEIALRLIDNLKDIKRDFRHILNLGGHSKHFSEYFNDKFMVSQDLSKKMAAQTTSIAVQADEELLPYKQESLDLIQSPLCLHWVNDLPGSLIQIRNCLKPDGLFLAAFLGGETLTELRQAFLKTEMNILGGVRPHVSPFIGVKEAGALMQRAGFTIPVINIERITVTYSDAFALMKELKAMGESNALIKRYKGLTSPKIMLEMARNYHEMFANDKGRIPATFDIVYVQGWAPHDSQQKPLKPGSAKVSLTKILGQEPPNSN